MCAQKCGTLAAARSLSRRPRFYAVTAREIEECESMGKKQEKAGRPHASRVRGVHADCQVDRGETAQPGGDEQIFSPAFSKMGSVTKEHRSICLPFARSLVARVLRESLSLSVQGRPTRVFPACVVVCRRAFVRALSPLCDRLAPTAGTTALLR